MVVENLKRNEIALDDPKNRLPKMETTWTHEKYRGSTVAKNWKQYCDTNTDEKKNSHVLSSYASGYVHLEDQNLGVWAAKTMQ